MIRKESAKEKRFLEAQREAERRRKLIEEYQGKSARPSIFPEKKDGTGSSS